MIGVVATASAASSVTASAEAQERALLGVSGVFRVAVVFLPKLRLDDGARLVALQ